MSKLKKRTPRAIKLRPLKAPEGVTTWCVPSAMSSLTGFEYDYCAAVINEVRGRPHHYSTQGVYVRELVWGLSGVLGIPLIKLKTPEHNRPTVAAFLRQRGPTLRRTPFMMVTTEHIAVVQGIRYVDNLTKSPVSIRKAPFRRARVQCIILLGDHAKACGSIRQENPTLNHL